ncbi:MAG: hypothetical protein V9F02_04235 [Chitinophagaceae bacterium]
MKLIAIAERIYSFRPAFGNTFVGGSGLPGMLGNYLKILGSIFFKLQVRLYILGKDVAELVRLHQ